MTFSQGSPFESEGVWWLTPDPDRQALGILLWTPRDGLHLRVVGQLAPSMLDRSGPVTVHGVCSGRLVTLLQCQSVNESSKLPGPSTQTVRAAGAVIGALVEGIDEPAFDAIRIDVENLDQIFGRSAPYRAYGTDHNAQRIEWDAQPDLVAGDNGRVFRLQSRSAADGAMPGDRLSLVATTSFKVEVERSTTISDLVARHVAPVRDLATLCAGQPARVRAVHLRVSEFEKRRDEGTAQLDEVVYLAQQIPAYEARRRLDSRAAAVVQLPHDPQSFSVLVRRWFEFYSGAGVVLGMRFATMYVDFGYVETKFLNACQAIESLHRHMFASERNESMRENADYLISLAPPAWKSWLADRFEYAAEPSFEDRLRKLYGDVGRVLEEPFRDGSELLAGLAKARNRLTHRSPKRPVPESAELRRLTVAANLLFDAWVFVHLGFSEDQVREVLKMTEPYQESCRAAYRTYGPTQLSAISDPGEGTQEVPLV